MDHPVNMNAVAKQTSAADSHRGAWRGLLALLFAGTTWAGSLPKYFVTQHETSVYAEASEAGQKKGSMEVATLGQR